MRRHPGVEVNLLDVCHTMSLSLWNSGIEEDGTQRARRFDRFSGAPYMTNRAETSSAFWSFNRAGPLVSLLNALEGPPNLICQAVIALGTLWYCHP